MATYPDDAIAPVTAFGVIAETSFSSTGAVQTDFNLASSADHKGEVVAIIDGVVQQTSTYDLSNSGGTVSFLTAPNASNLTLKTISLPARFRLTRSFPAVRSVDFSNTSAQVIDSNAFLINGSTESFALPEGVNVSSTSDFMVFLNGVFQTPDSYTYPSISYSFNGIDIGDNTATKLLANFNGNLNDESDTSHTLTKRGGAASYDSSERLVFDGTDDSIDIADSTDFNILQTSFTLDTFIKPDTGTSMTSNQSLFSKHQDATNNYNLRLVGANSNVGFVINNGGGVTELYGGNANGGVNLHVAVSYELGTQNLRLFVNNVKVAHTNFTSDPDFAGNVVIGANSNVAGSGEFFKGQIDFMRLSHVSRYKSDAIEPLTSYTPTVISGAPLGSFDSLDKLSIRVFDSEISTLDRFNSMADRKPDKGFSSQRKFDTITFESQAGYEKRRLRSRRAKRSYNLTYTNVTGIEKTAIENFYNARSGEFQSFTFDLTHLNDIGTITTRFDGPLTVNQVHSAGSNLTENFYTVSFNLQETYD